MLIYSIKYIDLYGTFIGKFSVGQNIGSKYGMQNYAEVIASWEKEITDFNADRTYSSAAGHYSAVSCVCLSLNVLTDRAVHSFQNHIHLQQTNLKRY